jgi:GNAT superfamily N-acetyltransferase
MSSITLRLARPDDKPDRLKVTQAAWIDAYREFMPVALMESLWRGEIQEWSSYAGARQGDPVRWVVEWEGKIVGHIGLIGRAEQAGEVGEISPLYIHPNAQGRGIGKILLRQAEAYARERWMPELWVFALEQGPGVPFYTRQGFELRRMESINIGERVFPVAGLRKSL